jgi:hypothetical protein
MKTEKRITATGKFGYMPKRGGYTPAIATVNVDALPRAPKGGTGAAVTTKPAKK